MRQTILAVLLAIFTTLLLPPVWDRFLSAAPDWVWRLLIVTCVLVGVLLVLLYEPVWTRLSAPRQTPVSSTAIVALSAAVIVAVAWLTFLVTKSETQLSFSATTSAADYSSGTTIGGLLWSPRFTELRITITNPSSEAYTDIDLTIVPDEPIAAIAQVTNVANVSFAPRTSHTVRQELLEHATGKRTANPLVLIASDAGYRLQCPTLTRHTKLEIVVAIARVKDFPVQPNPSPAPDLGLFEREYALKLNLKSGKALWYGHGLDANGRIEEVYSSEKPVSKIVHVTGRYQTGQTKHAVSEYLVVRDFIRSSMPRLKDSQHLP